ncbi:MAG: DNA mismatch repair protein MutS [Clostridiales Family XIII bacterium]|jgi:DNA mismatch repair protein MutS|nr:DNA mismatch repair protein MutS [Clostridiales Family XIII bacterium]
MTMQIDEDLIGNAIGVTPMMQQYLDIKKQYADSILFFRLGDFYEMFWDDALLASGLLEITLTKKNCGIGTEKAPMCGVPFHSADSYIAKLVSLGHKVAICEQVEDPALAKDLVKRDVVRIVTPGTVTGESMLNAQENSYLASIYRYGQDGRAGSEQEIGLAWCDITTGELAAAVISGTGMKSKLSSELSRIGAKEILINEIDDPAFETEIREQTDVYLSALPDTYYDEKRGKRAVLALSGASSLKGLGTEEDGCIANALFGLFAYLEETQKQPLHHLKSLEIHSISDHMMLDKSSIRNLELTETIYDRQVKGSLLGVLDRTRTAMGGRLIKKWLRMPLIAVPEVARRLDAVDVLVGDLLMRNNIREHLKSVYDLERLAGRVSYGIANGRDLIALKNSVSVIPELRRELSDAPEDSLLAEILADTDDLSDVRELIEEAIVEDPPFTIREGGVIRRGYSEELDALKDGILDGQQWIASLEGRERERTGIKNLKVGFNRVFGYYIDITNGNKSLVPDDYIRKQTLVNSERYITPDLKEAESRVLGAEAKINQTEYDLFNALRIRLQAYIPLIQQTSAALAALDVLASFAEISEKNGYVKPVVTEGDVIRIVKGRHPVIEENLTDRRFVPNDVYIDRDSGSLLLITGPNMAGKSTYMRMTALIVLMAQAGCFVPAEDALIGACDRLYTRIGASDNLAKGESTFYVEMSELAYILNTASDKSLVILDEIGRGTSTYDGLAIAWAVCEYLCTGSKRIRTLFATHYHELTVLEGKLPGLKNLNTDISEEGGEIVFLHRIKAGSSNRSYGIHVAKLAGVPATLLCSAEEKLALLENERKEIEIDYERHDEHAPKQISLFDFAPNPVITRLKALNLLDITPSQAFSILEDLKTAAEKDES